MAHPAPEIYNAFPGSQMGVGFSACRNPGCSLAGGQELVSVALTRDSELDGSIFPAVLATRSQLLGDF